MNTNIEPDTYKIFRFSDRSINNDHCSPVLIFIFLTAILLVSMPPLHEFFDIEVKLIFMVSIAALFVVALLKSTLLVYSKQHIIFICVVLIFSFTGSLYSNSFFQLTQGFTLSAMIFAISINARLAYNKIVIGCILAFNFVLLIGAWIGFFYALNGGQPLLQLHNRESGDMLVLYLFTFTNSVYGNVIRPAGVFDEPGALAMFSIITAGLNDIAKGKQSHTVAILSLSLITFSLTSVMALILFFLINLNRSGNLRLIQAYAVGLIAAIIFTVFNTDIVSERLFARVLIEDGRFQGDNRSGGIASFFDEVDIPRFLSGSHALSIPDYGGVSDPFTILAVSGFFVWVPYALLVVSLIVFGMVYGRSRRFAAFSLAALLLQRPVLYSLPWGLFICYFIAVLFNQRSNKSDLFSHERPV